MFNVSFQPTWDTGGKWVDRWCIRDYRGTGTSSVVESQSFGTKAEAQAAADRANAGDESGLMLALYADD